MGVYIKVYGKHVLRVVGHAVAKEENMFFLLGWYARKHFEQAVNKPGNITVVKKRLTFLLHTTAPTVVFFCH